MSRKSNLAQISAIACTLSLLLSSTAWAAAIHVNVPVVHPKVPVVSVKGAVTTPKGGHAFEIKNFSFGVENPTTIGSGSSGAGAGKIKFNEFSVTKTADKASPSFFKNATTGSRVNPRIGVRCKVC